MRRSILSFFSSLTVFTAIILLAAVGMPAHADECVTIQDGTLQASNGDILQTGYDQYGYNYQAHQFNGDYDNFSRPAELADTGIKLVMKWNEAWLSNKDCDDDGLLDRHRGYSSYIDSGAWITNHMTWVEDGQHYSYFVKIVAVESSDDLVNGIWYDADGTEIGPTIWGQFAIVQEILSGEGALYVSPAGPGFGS